MGIARHDGVSVELHKAPDIEGLQHMTEMDYIPGVIVDVRVGCEKTREMTAQEQYDTLALLARMSVAARGVV